MWRNFYRVTNAYSPLRVPPYLEDIRQQPAAVAQLLDSGMSEECRHLLGRAQKYDRIVMTGMGASLFGMYPGFLRLASAGLAVWEVETAELLGPANGLITPNTLLWLTSQSGSSAEIQALLDRLPHRPAATLGVTNDPLSPLGTHADVVLELQSGPEHTVGTRSYVNTLVATAMAVATVLGQPFDPELSRVPDRLSAYLGGWDEHVQKLDQSVPESTIFVLGRGASLAAARTGSLVIKEASGRPVEGMSVPQFRHGPLEMAGPGVTVLLLAGRAPRAGLSTARCSKTCGPPAPVPSGASPQAVPTTSGRRGSTPSTPAPSRKYCPCNSSASSWPSVTGMSRGRSDGSARSPRPCSNRHGHPCAWSEVLYVTHSRERRSDAKPVCARARLRPDPGRATHPSARR